jgi:hypothetical protein
VRNERAFRSDRGGVCRNVTTRAARLLACSRGSLSVCPLLSCLTLRPRMRRSPCGFVLCDSFGWPRSHHFSKPFLVIDHIENRFSQLSGNEGQFEERRQRIFVGASFVLATITTIAKEVTERGFRHFRYFRRETSDRNTRRVNVFRKCHRCSRVHLVPWMRGHGTDPLVAPARADVPVQRHRDTGQKSKPASA